MEFWLHHWIVTILLSFLTIPCGQLYTHTFQIAFFQTVPFCICYQQALFVRSYKGLTVSSDSTHCCNSIKVWNNSAGLHKAHIFDKIIWNSPLHDYPLCIFIGLICSPGIFLWLFCMIPFRFYFFTEIYNLFYWNNSNSKMLDLGAVKLIILFG